MEILIATVTGYLLGSIPVGLVVTRVFQGVDVREYGSGKTGFTNTLRVMGLRRSAPVFIGDLGKGLAATLMPLAYSDDPWARSAGGLAAIAGHVWPVFAGFRGGRGVLAGAGVLLGLNPLACLAVVPPALAVMLTTKYMSLASIAGAGLAAVAFVAFAALDWHSWAYAFAAVLGAGAIIVLHRDNIDRLRAGIEPKIGQGGQRRATA